MRDHASPCACSTEARTEDATRVAAECPQNPLWRAISLSAKERLEDPGLDPSAGVRSLRTHVPFKDIHARAARARCATARTLVHAARERQSGRLGGRSQQRAS